MVKPLQVKIKSLANSYFVCPQNIFLIDSTISENIAFGVPSNEIDFERVVEVSRLADCLAQ